MNQERKNAILAGALYFVGLVAGVLTVVPVIDLPDYLVQISANSGKVVSGALFQFLMLAAYVGMAILLFPALKKINESLALGYVGFRLVAAVFIGISAILLFLLIALSQEYVKAGMPLSSHYQTMGEMLRIARNLINHAGMMLVFSMGSLFLYGMIFHSKLLPRWLSGWGLIATVVAILASVLFLSRAVDLTATVYLSFPLALQEMVFAAWLIAKGFNPAALHAASLPSR